MIGRNMEVGSVAVSVGRSSHYGNKTPHHQLLKQNNDKIRKTGLRFLSLSFK
jgi:hypothetical protein